MQVTAEKLLSQLPKNTGPWVMVKERQSVDDIISLILKQHKAFASDYDKIAGYFKQGTVEETCNQLYDFCVRNLHYVEESEDFQSVGNPASIIERGNTGIDCKSYALFIGGCLDALKRQGDNIDWFYRFASYDIDVRVPYHVFIAVDLHDGGPLLYVDPTPGSYEKEPFWIIDERVKTRPAMSIGRIMLNNDRGLIGAVVAGADPSWGTLIPAPTWYPSYLPKFYRDATGAVYLRPVGVVAKYTQNDVLDCLLYLQTFIGYNRIDASNAISAAWYKTDLKDGFQLRIKHHFEGEATGNMIWVPQYNIGLDGPLYSQLQARYIANESGRPWLSAMQSKGGGIDLMTIPAASDTEIQRPTWYPNYLPSLFISAGEIGQYAKGFVNTKPKIRNGKSSTWGPYEVTAEDIAAYMLYAQPIIAAGPTPYPVNWYINDDVNGAMASYFKISLGFIAGHTNAQMQAYGITGDVMKQPVLDADPYTSSFGKTLQSIVSAAVQFFANKIPGGAKAMQAAYAAGSIGGGESITGGPMPAGAFSAAVFAAADKLALQLKTTAEKKQATKNYLMLGAIAAGLLGWYYWDDIKKL